MISAQILDLHPHYRGQTSTPPQMYSDPAFTFHATLQDRSLVGDEVMLSYGKFFLHGCPKLDLFCF